MKPRKKGKKWEITYRCPGYSKLISERFPSYEAANVRIAEIEYEKSIGELRPPQALPKSETDRPKKFRTVSELLEEYVSVYGLTHWGDSYLSFCRQRIRDYINPYIGDVPLCDLTTHSLDIFFNSLQYKPAVVLKGHKQTDKMISPSVIEKVYTLLRSALHKAVTWGYITINPAENVSLPKYKRGTREVWTEEVAQKALDLCSDPVLHLAMLLAIGCSMRIGEILGLTWDCVDASDESVSSNTATVYIDKELKRCNKSSLADLERLDRSTVRFTFPEEKRTTSTTALVLKAPKTDSSIRKVYLSETVAHALREMKSAQQDKKDLLGAAYQDFGLVLAHDDGRPYEERQIADMLRRFIREHDLPPVVFHSLRHCSASIKLKLSGGNIKAVQGDTGHAQARMVTDQYAHIFDDDRRHLAQQMEHSFFRGDKDSPSPETGEKGAAAEDFTQVLQLLQKNPDLAKLIVTLSQSAAS